MADDERETVRKSVSVRENALSPTVCATETDGVNDVPMCHAHGDSAATLPAVFDGSFSVPDDFGAARARTYASF